MEIGKVLSKDKGRVEGIRDSMPWLLAKDRFIGYFQDAQRGSGYFEFIEEDYGLNVYDAEEWAGNWNRFISDLNGLPTMAKEEVLIQKFGLHN